VGYGDTGQFTENKATTPVGLTEFGGGIPRVVEDSNPGLWAATPLGLMLNLLLPGVGFGLGLDRVDVGL